MLYGEFMRLISGVGVNDYCGNVTFIDGGRRKPIPAYSAWSSMLNRCYSKAFQERQPTYKGVTVCDDWLVFTNFKKWFDVAYIDGYELDKDIIGDGSAYSPDSCIYIPQWLNKFTTGSNATRGCCPIGACHRKDIDRYQANCRHPFGKYEYLGYFMTQDEAHSAWKKRKLEIAEELKGRMDEIDLRIYQRVVEIILKAK